MNANTWTMAAIVAVPVLTLAGAVLLLDFRVGKLIGQTEARLNANESNSSRLWEANGKMGARLDQHLELSHRGSR